VYCAVVLDNVQSQKSSVWSIDTAPTATLTTIAPGSWLRDGAGHFGRMVMFMSSAVAAPLVLVTVNLKVRVRGRSGQ
jgi:hypothetical protein